MKTVYLVSNYALIAIRFWLVVGLFGTGKVSAVLLGLIGFIAILTTVAAWSEGEPDLTWQGVCVGVGHLAVMLFRPGEMHVVAVAPIFWFLVIIQTWAKWHLGRRCTVSGPVWVNLVASGPYLIVRHPMTATELLLAVAFVAEYPSAWNGFALVFVVASKFAITILEEKFLKQKLSYRLYCYVVRYRFIPGVW